MDPIKLNFPPNSSRTDIANVIKTADKIALFHHIKPDHDSLGCSYGFLLAIKQLFPTKTIVFIADYDEIVQTFNNLSLDKSHFASDIDSTFLAVIGDNSVQSRIAHYDIYEKAGKKVCFDHHENKNTDFPTDVAWIDPTYPASVIQAMEILVLLGEQKLNPDPALFLAAGILSDTGNFAYSLSDIRAPFYYAYLLQSIADDQLRSFFNNSRQKSTSQLYVLQKALMNVQLFGAVAYTVINKDENFVASDFDAVKSLILSAIGNIAGYPIWAVFFDKGSPTDNVIDVNLRSNRFDIVEVAKRFNGGGHALAAGAKITSEEDIPKVVSALNALHEESEPEDIKQLDLSKMK